MLPDLNPTQAEQIGVLRPDLMGASHLAWLPEKAPAVMLHSIESTFGERVPIQIKDLIIGGPELVLMAGPCSIDENNYVGAAVAARDAGAWVLRGGAFKPRSSPYSFQGLGERGLRMQKEIADRLGMLVVSEATGEGNLPVVARYSDIIQIGARNSQNFELLVATGKIAKKLDKGVLYKRGQAMSIEEFLLGAEYILATGCKKVVLCERGSVTKSGVTLDSDGIVELLKRTHLPVIADPTHSAKIAAEVPDLAHQAIIVGVDGLIIEVYPKPEEAKSDGARALLPDQLLSVSQMMSQEAPEGRFFNQIL